MIKNAFLSIKKSIGKTILLFVIIFIIANLVIAGFSMKSASTKATEAIQSTLGNDVILSTSLIIGLTISISWLDDDSTTEIISLSLTLSHSMRISLLGNKTISWTSKTLSFSKVTPPKNDIAFYYKLF